MKNCLHFIRKLSGIHYGYALNPDWTLVPTVTIFATSTAFLPLPMNNTSMTSKQESKVTPRALKVNASDGRWDTTCSRDHVLIPNYAPLRSYIDIHIM